MIFLEMGRNKCLFICMGLYEYGIGLSYIIRLMFRTSKCNHGEKGMCINCLVNKQKHNNSNTTQNVEKKTVIECQHPTHMKCLRCLPMQEKQKSMCEHPDYRKCQHCEHLIRY